MTGKTVLLGFSGGLDSTLCAVKLRNAGYKVELGYVPWYIEGSRFGELQHTAAYTVADALSLPLLELARVACPAKYQAKWAWVQVIVSMVMWHAAYPIMRYDAVAFGMQVGECESWQRVAHNKAMVEANARIVNYGGELLFPVSGMSRAEEWAQLPPELRPLVWCCNIPTASGRPCGGCYKCKHDIGLR
jgi:hypothetical protein